MKVQSDPSILLRRALVAANLAAMDTLDDARRIASQHSISGRFERSLEVTPFAVQGDELVARLGSPLRSATTKERGAYIQAKHKPWLMIHQPDGSFRKVKAVRIPARPVVSRAGPRFLEHMSRRLREEAG